MIVAAASVLSRLPSFLAPLMFLFVLLGTANCFGQSQLTEHTLKLEGEQAADIDLAGLQWLVAMRNSQTGECNEVEFEYHRAP